MFSLIGILMWWISQDFKGRPEVEYELVKNEKSGEKNTPMDLKNSANLDKIVNAVGSKADKESENLDLAENLSEGSKGQKGIGVAEAPKGGIANEAPVVGNDEEELVGTGKGGQKQQKLMGTQRGKVIKHLLERQVIKILFLLVLALLLVLIAPREKLNLYLMLKMLLLLQDYLMKTQFNRL